MAKKSKNQEVGTTIATNRKASHDYYLETKFEAGIVLSGWEVKSMRDNRANLKESYILARAGELFLVGAHVSASATTSTHKTINPTRQRKLLLHRAEITRLIASVERRGYALIPMRLYWKQGRVKLQFALAKGKKVHDKRASIKSKDVERDQARELSERLRQ